MATSKKTRCLIISRMIICLATSSSVVVMAQSATSDTAGLIKTSITNSVKLTGFVDASYLYNLESVKSTFGFNQAELDIQRSIEQFGEIRVDLEMTNNQSDEFDYTAEQGYIVLAPTSLGQTEIVFGKFNAPIGFEGADPTELYQTTCGLVSDYCLPENLTGLMISSQIKSGLDLSLHISNGWDNNFDSDNKKTVGGQISYALGDNINLALAAIRGADSDSTNDMLSDYDFNFGVYPYKDLLIGGEINIARQTDSGMDKQWRGALIMSHISISEHLGFTGRYDYLEDRGGICFDNEFGETRQALTFATTFDFGNGLSSITEYRLDVSNRNSFESSDSELSKNSSAMAFELIYKF
jgi:hypothetical protein